MNLEELRECLEDALGTSSFTIDTNAAGELIVHTGYREDDDGELIPFEADEDDEEESEVDSDFEPLADEEDE